MKLKSYPDAYRYLCKFTDYERMTKVHYGQTTYNLKRMKSLLDALGNPQDNLRCIHITGTKGKGSTAMMIAQILSSAGLPCRSPGGTKAGYRVGLYTSPHLVDLRERIQVWHNGKETVISKNDFTILMNYFVSKTKRSTLYAPRSSRDAPPTFFETMTAMAFLYFTREGVDFAVIEVGMGGRLDATNLITPIASVITRIDLDHTNKLGNTIKKIASEKAGIIKKGVPVITFRQNTSADKVISQKASAQNAPLHIIKIAPDKINLPGRHQQENYSLACGVVKLLNSRGYTDINTAGINKALKGLALPARLEFVSHKPDVILDSAHNTVSIKTTVETVKQRNYRKIIVILALSKDKDVEKILDIIIPEVDIAILTKTPNPRLMEPNEFLKYLPSRMDKTILLEPDYINALNIARRLATSDDLILITGSFYLAGEIKKLLNTNRNHRFHRFHRPACADASAGR
ncbi:MAG: folylpolyglutamate synthase/dihydrofolate synthase family protein [Planctomycetota bacterium]